MGVWTECKHHVTVDLPCKLCDAEDKALAEFLAEIVAYVRVLAVEDEAADYRSSDVCGLCHRTAGPIADAIEAKFGGADGGKE